MTDIEIINAYKDKTKIYFVGMKKEIKSYLQNRFNDSDSIKESFYRVMNKIYDRPTCKYCGGHVKFVWSKKFLKYCCLSCRMKIESPFKSKEIQNKIKERNIEKYGVDNVFKLKEFHDKSKQTKLDRYGDENYNNKEKFKETCLKKYGVNAPSQNKEIRRKQIETSIKRYGGVFHKEEVSKTIKRKYGVDWFVYSDKLKQKSNSDEAHYKSYITKKKNGSFGPQSKIESICYLYLSLYYPDTIRQYRDNNRYPYNCDFYIPCLDLFIEYQGFYTHNDHPYNKNSIRDQVILERIKRKYKDWKKLPQIITTWTIKDVEKRNIAKRNNLNYKEFFTIDELKDWLENG